jgi:hypothetical protein
VFRGWPEGLSAVSSHLDLRPIEPPAVTASKETPGGGNRFEGPTADEDVLYFETDLDVPLGAVYVKKRSKEQTTSSMSTPAQSRAHSAEVPGSPSSGGLVVPTC